MNRSAYPAFRSRIVRSRFDYQSTFLYRLGRRIRWRSERALQWYQPPAHGLADCAVDGVHVTTRPDHTYSGAAVSQFSCGPPLVRFTTGTVALTKEIGRAHV